VTAETPSAPSPPSKPESTLLLLVRHGETPTTGMVLPGRAPGLHLSDRGRSQAERVAERLAGLKVDAVYSSPLERTCETAEPTAAAVGLAVRGEPGLIECDFGEWTGVALAELAGLPEWQTVQHNPSAFRFPSGESFTQMQRGSSGRSTGDSARRRRRHLFFARRPDQGGSGPRWARTWTTCLSSSVSAISYSDGQAPAVLMVNSTSELLSGLRT
jgi:hypothetical protein